MLDVPPSPPRRGRRWRRPSPPAVGGGVLAGFAAAAGAAAAFPAAVDAGRDLASPFVVDSDLPGTLRYDGHGGLSAGAASRLLYDYEEPHRSQILDYLYKPKFGASLHLVKVEIGGDSQSTDGTEASHQHIRADLSCHRGYEWWLLEEARKRNPGVVTFALSWAVPSWVGNDTYYSQDNIDYHVSWLMCARDQHPSIGSIDFMGAWNERAWGTADWIKNLRATMDREGFAATKLVLPDDFTVRDVLTALERDASLRGALEGGGVGLHYPCDQPHPEVQGRYGLKYWSSEDFSTEANWSGAGCWGRILNQNVIRMNMTSTISWGLVWAVYDDWPYFGNGLMYAYWPWSGHYTVNGAIWTSAHHCQFIEPGWLYVPGSGRGYLASGGSYVALVDSQKTNVTIVIEKLHGACLRCAGQTTRTETVALRLAGSLARLHGNALAVWKSNKTHQFIRFPDAVVDASGILRVRVFADSIVTLSSTTGQCKGSFGVPPRSEPFPLPHADDFEGRRPPAVPRYFSDNGGSFEIAGDPTNSANQVLAQVVAPPPLRNAWAKDVEPTTVLGDKGPLWSSGVEVSVDVFIPDVWSSTSPLRPAFSNLQNMYNELCLDVKSKNQAAGSAIDTRTCVADYNEQFWLDERTGLFHAQGANGSESGVCVSAGPCPTAGLGLCQLPCAAGDANQTWVIQADSKLRLSGDTFCAEAQLDGALLMTPCAPAGAPRRSQSWRLLRAAGGRPYAGVCLHVGGGGSYQRRGHCFHLYADDSTWALTEDAWILASGSLGSVAAVGRWLRLGVAASARGAWLTGSLDGRPVAAAAAGRRAALSGRVALASGWNKAYFDNFSAAPRRPRPPPARAGAGATLMV